MIKQRKQLITGVLMVGILINGLGISSYANEIKKELTSDEIMAIPGLVYIMGKFGDEEGPSTISYGCFGSDYYGYASLNKDKVVEFIKWLVEQDSKYGEVFNVEEIEGVEDIEDVEYIDEFKELWTKASELDEYDFALKQQTYIMETEIKPMIERLEKKTGIKMSGHRGIEELIYIKHSSYPYYDGVNFVKDALLKCDDKENIDFNKLVDDVLKLEKKYIRKMTKENGDMGEKSILVREKHARWLKEINAYSINGTLEGLDVEEKTQKSLFDLIKSIFKF